MNSLEDKVKEALEGLSVYPESLAELVLENQIL
jgi:hypothetical protein